MSDNVRSQFPWAFLTFVLCLFMNCVHCSTPSDVEQIRKDVKTLQATLDQLQMQVSEVQNVVKKDAAASD